MTGVPFATSTCGGDDPQASSGRLVNCYAEALSGGGPSEAIYRRAPGLQNFADTGYSNYRGGIGVAPYVYAAMANMAVHVDALGNVEPIEALPGNGPVDFARNNVVPAPDVVAVSEDGAFVITSTSVTELSDPDLPPPNSVCAVDGYFFFTIADGRCFSSNLNSTEINGLNFIKAESNPDGLLRGVGFQSQLYLCGTASIEVWSNTAEPVGFPFSRATVIPRGIIGRQAITGFEDGFSKQIMFVGDDCQVYALQGYTPSKISTPDLDRLIQRDASKTLIECWSYTIDGKPCLVVSGSTWTWVYDLSTSKWHERKSYNALLWRASKSIYAFGKWLVGDRSSTMLMELSPLVYQEAGDPLIFDLISGVVSAFPNRIAAYRADFNFRRGIGSADGAGVTETDPKCWISWADDGGYGWGRPLLRDLGRQGKTEQLVSITRCGMCSAFGKRFRIEVSDPVPVAFMAADMTPAVRRF